ncbi:hypothetical protein UFOVP181_304 [uncultured Caudovirales phage]|uniref:Uncharacterized protein n=1 Tax=uncultured Caudovirales phage TaxID=2100421 RepID=A0A6J5KU37_9CAUD|nr:hypothetical protein UFOVP57_335 [uncultured Caudovirales phage]CAB5209069.1 hypothetical protein UFOVP181_304 [uncultured Caudovirales phage]
MATWTIKTYYKKSCQEVEFWVRREGEGKITVTNGFRFGEWTVETTDDNFPEFEFTEVPGGDGKKDSINMLDCEVNNIESVELVEMFDGGCWYDIDFEDLTEEEEEEIQEFIDENSVCELEDRDDAWYNDETEWWVWGPLEITDEAGNSRIIVADSDGNVVDFKDE